jgi:hypothetical protein
MLIKCFEVSTFVGGTNYSCQRKKPIPPMGGKERKTAQMIYGMFSKMGE